MKIKDSIKLIKQDYWNLWYFWQGTIREWIWNNYPIIMRTHIKEQFIYRTIKAYECAKNGSCIVCGCTTPALFFANKPCALSHVQKSNWHVFGKTELCYPKMMNKKEWNDFKQLNNL
jgi:hypothetical protein